MRIKLTVLAAISVLVFNQAKTQATIQSLTRYETERKSFDYVSQSEEYILVDNGFENLSVLTVDSSGQLYTYFTSDIPYCISGRKIKTSLNNELILFNYEDHIILQNFHTGDIRRIDNLPVFNDNSSILLLDSNYFQIYTDSIHLYSINTGALIGIYDYAVSIKGNLILSYVTIDSTRKRLIENVNTGATIILDEDYNVISTDNFPGFIVQRRPYGINENISEEFTILLLNQDGKIDTIDQELPKLSFADLAKNDTTLIMLNKYYSEDSWNSVFAYYSFDLKTNSLRLLDTISETEILFEHIISDSLVLYANYENYFLHNIIEKSRVKIELPEYASYYYRIQDYLMFLEFNTSIYAYNFKSNDVVKVSDFDVLSASNVFTIFKNNKVFYFDLHQMNLPLYEVSDTIYSRNQEIALEANNNGLRTSFLEKSNNYIYSFVDDGIVVLDTTNSLGYRKKTIIDHTINLGCFDFGWYEFEDVVYGVIPIYKNNKKNYELVSVSLANLEVKNLSEEYGIFSSTDQTPRSMAGSHGFIYQDKTLFDIKNKHVHDLSSVSGVGYIANVLKFDNRVIVFTQRDLFEFSYPEFILLNINRVDFQRYVGDKFFIYRASQTNGNLWVSDGTQKIEIENSKDLYIYNGHQYNLYHNFFTMRNVKTNEVNIYQVDYDDNSSLVVSKMFGGVFEKVPYLSEHHFEDYVGLSLQSNTSEITILYHIVNKDTIQLQNVIVHDIINIENGFITCKNNELKRIQKIDLNGQLIEYIDYPEFVDLIFPLHKVNKKHNGLFILEAYANYKYSKLVFDNHLFTILFDSGCSNEFYTRTSHENVVYKDNAYYFNLDLDENGKQIYRLPNPYQSETNSTNSSWDYNTKIYPNPVSSLLHISTSSACSITALHIYDVLGRNQNVPFTKCQQDVLVENLKPGIYMLEIVEGLHRRVMKFVKL